MRGSFWQKDNLITHILFELQPIIIFSPVPNFGDQSLPISNLTLCRDLSEVFNYGNYINMAVPDIEFTSDPFLPGNVQDLMESGQFDSEVEIIIGTNADDGMLFVLSDLLFPILFEEFKENFNTSAPMALFDVPFVSGLK